MYSRALRESARTGRPRDLQLCRDILENVSTPQIGVPVEVLHLYSLPYGSDMTMHRYRRQSRVKAAKRR